MASGGGSARLAVAVAVIAAICVGTTGTGAAENDEGPISDGDGGHSDDGALQSTLPAPTIPNTQQNFGGLSNEDNFAIFGGRVNSPDPNGEVGPNNYIEMVNLTFAVYDKSGNRLLGPVDTGTLWDNFAVPDCTDPSGDPGRPLRPVHRPLDPEPVHYPASTAPSSVICPRSSAPGSTAWASSPLWLARSQSSQRRAPVRGLM